MHSDPSSYEQGTRKRAAALASLFMGLANNGGLNHFLEASYDFDAQEIIEALHLVGAHKAAGQLEEVVAGLAISLPPMSQDERWNALEEHWSGHLNDLDVLSSQAEKELMVVLERHVAENEQFYINLMN